MKVEVVPGRYVPPKRPIPDESQHGEYVFLERWFKVNAPVHKFVVDVGALGRMYSNSWGLLKAGWKGLLIDADPGRMGAIKMEFSRLDVEIVNVGVGDADAEMDLHLHNALGHNSFLADWYPDTATDKTVKVKVRPLADILREWNVPLDFDLLSVDTEGMDEVIMKALFATSEYRPGVVVTECTSYREPDELFGAAGYEFVRRTGNPAYGNLIYARKR
jgi:FkbM family methyltransferase